MPLLVQQQDRARVGVEQSAGGVEEVLGGVGPGVGECSVGDSLQSMEPMPESPHGAKDVKRFSRAKPPS